MSTPCRIGINGFGRIGRNVLRASLLRQDVVVVAINHTCANVEDLIHLIMHDSTHGALIKLSNNRKITVDILPNGNIAVNNQEVVLLSERNPEKLDWAAHRVEYVAECTGKFRTVSQASSHVEHGKAKKVLISAPSADAETYVYRVNSGGMKKSTAKVFSCASCTTNCLAPIAKVLDDSFGIVQATMTTVHASTQSQHVLDGYSKKDRRSGRSVFQNIIPTTTGASKAIKAVLPNLAGKIAGLSVRVPTANVSMVDLNVQTLKPSSLQEVMQQFRLASKTSLAGVLDVEDEELVSCDFLGNPASAIVDVKASIELNPHFFKIIAWYDNEWSYSCRLLDMLVLMQQTDLERETVPVTFTSPIINASTSLDNGTNSNDDVVNEHSLVRVTSAST